MSAYSLIHSSMLTEANMTLTFDAVDRTFIALKAANGDNDLFVDPISEQVTFEGKCKRDDDDDDDWDDDCEGDDDDEDC